VGSWSAADAKIGFSRFLEESHKEPQIVLLRGKPAGVLIDYDLYKSNESVLMPGRLRELLAQLKEINTREGDFDLPERRNRNPGFPEEM
jgi:prevent-host-death family protein